MKFKKCDWVFADFRLMMIDQHPEPNRSISVFDGLLSTSSERVFPLTLHNNLMSMHASAWYDKITELKAQSLNMPDISEKIKEYWAEGCRGGEKNREKYYELISTFCRDIMQQVDRSRDITSRGVNIFK